MYHTINFLNVVDWLQGRKIRESFYFANQSIGLKSFVVRHMKYQLKIISIWNGMQYRQYKIITLSNGVFLSSFFHYLILFLSFPFWLALIWNGPGNIAVWLAFRERAGLARDWVHEIDFPVGLISLSVV